MTHKNTLRPAMTALAAVIALSSAPSFAQTADEPVVTTAPAIEVTPAPIVADPVTTAPVVDSTVADPLAAAATPKPAARKATTAKTAAKSRPAATRAASAPIAAAPAAASAVPAIAAPVVEPLPVEPPAATAAPPVVADPPADTAITDALPAAGIGGLALLVLAGAGLAIRRRRRRAREAEDAAWQQDVESAADPVAEPFADPVADPAMVAEPESDLELTRPVFATPVEPAYAVAPALAAAAPAAAEASPEADGPVTELPEGFDLSRFGFNVQEAYKGPTEDNPSLSLKHRLSRASGMDQQERKLDAEVEAVTGEAPLAETDDPAPAAEAPTAKPADGTSAKGDFLLARDGNKPSVRPAHTP